MAEALPWIGVGLHWDELAELLVAPDTPPRTRALVQAALLQADPARAGEVIKTLSNSIMVEVVAASVASIFADLEEGAADSSSLANLLEGAPPDRRVSMFENLEQLRADTELPASVAWGAVLRRRCLGALHRQVLDAVTAEGGNEAEELLEGLRAQSGGKKARRLYDNALKTIRTRDVSRQSAPAPSAGRCWASPCDGQGAFVAIMMSEAPTGRIRISNIVVRTSAAPRDGFLISGADETDLEELLETFRRRFPMQQAPLAEVAALVMQGLRRGKASGVKPSKDIRLGLRAFEKVHRKSRAALEPLSPVPPAEPEQYRRLLSELSSWFLDSGDLFGQGIDEPPPDEGPTPRWITAAAKRLQGSPVQARLLAMTDYQSRWFVWVGEEELAVTCAAAHTELSGDLRQSAFVAELLGLSAELLDEEDEELDVSRLGDPDVRSDLRSIFFSDVVTATGRDLARLDYTEAAGIALDQAVRSLSGELRPTADAQHELAHQLGCMYVDIDLRGREALTALEDFEEPAAALLAAELKLSADDAEMLAEDVLDALVSFQGEVCVDCEVNCLANPDRDHTQLFHSTRYPPWIGED